MDESGVGNHMKPPCPQPPSQRASRSDPMRAPPAPRLRPGRRAVEDAAPKATMGGLGWLGMVLDTLNMLGLCLVCADLGVV